jgi:hypothetical protein
MGLLEGLRLLLELFERVNFTIFETEFAGAN